jgi:hypothetical protein
MPRAELLVPYPPKEYFASRLFPGLCLLVWPKPLPRCIKGRGTRRLGVSPNFIVLPLCTEGLIESTLIIIISTRVGLRP